jgi:hypothetical protein
MACVFGHFTPAVRVIGNSCQRIAGGSAAGRYNRAMQALQPYDPNRKVQILGDLWKATRKGTTLRVQLRTHPLGWELLAFVGLDMHRSVVVKTEADVTKTSDEWKAEAVQRGWAAE